MVAQAELIKPNTNTGILPVSSVTQQVECLTDEELADFLTKANMLAWVYGDGEPILPNQDDGCSLFSHTVATGDTLYNLAKRYGTTVAEIMKVNGLLSDRIYIAQKLKIPSQCGIEAAGQDSNTPTPTPTETIASVATTTPEATQTPAPTPTETGKNRVEIKQGLEVGLEGPVVLKITYPNHYGEQESKEIFIEDIRLLAEEYGLDFIGTSYHFNKLKVVDKGGRLAGLLPFSSPQIVELLTAIRDYNKLKEIAGLTIDNPLQAGGKAQRILDVLDKYNKRIVKTYGDQPASAEIIFSINNKSADSAYATDTIVVERAIQTALQRKLKGITITEIFIDGVDISFKIIDPEGTERLVALIDIIGALEMKRLGLIEAGIKGGGLQDSAQSACAAGLIVISGVTGFALYRSAEGKKGKTNGARRSRAGAMKVRREKRIRERAFLLGKEAIKDPLIVNGITFKFTEGQEGKKAGVVSLDPDNKTVIIRVSPSAKIPLADLKRLSEAARAKFGMS